MFRINMNNTFHFHNGLIRNILVAGSCLSCDPLLVSLIIGHNYHCSSLEALKWASLAFLSARVNVGLENWENCWLCHRIITGPMLLLVVMENNVCLNLETTHCFRVVQEQKSALILYFEMVHMDWLFQFFYMIWKSYKTYIVNNFKRFN